MAKRTVTLGGNAVGPEIEIDDELEIIDVRRRAAERHVFHTPSDSSGFSDETERARRRAAGKAFAEALKAQRAGASASDGDE